MRTSPVIVSTVIKMKLTEAEIGKYYRILRVNLEHSKTKRLLSMGLYEGVCFTIERKNVHNRVLLVYVSGNFMMLRYQDAEKIEVMYL